MGVARPRELPSGTDGVGVETQTERSGNPDHPRGLAERVDCLCGLCGFDASSGNERAVGIGFGRSQP